MVHYEKAWQAVRARIDVAARAAGRAPESVRLLAVSKTFPAEAVRALHSLGQRAFGENYVQEAVAKMDALADLGDAEWHLIGPLQSNKTRAAAERFKCVQTIERARIAERLSAARPAGLPPLDVLLQVNISGEASKSGVAPDETLALAAQIVRLPRLRLRGLMGIAEPTPIIATRRAQYRILRALSDQCRSAGIEVDTLSMGMSADLEEAIAEGATLVRVGTALFGARERSLAVERA
jgi:pyridoxal phosphate enzyme (YggS family)